MSNMKTSILAFLLLAMAACTDSEPDCIEKRISEFKETQADCPRARIEKFLFNGLTLYGFTDGQCIADGGTSLVDEDCNNYCFIGGIAALTDCKGIPFAENAELVEVLWDNNN